MSDMNIDRNDIVQVILAGIERSAYANAEMKTLARELAAKAEQEYSSMSLEDQERVATSFWSDVENEPSTKDKIKEALSGMFGKAKDVTGQVVDKVGAGAQDMSAQISEAMAERGWNKWASTPEGQREVASRQIREQGGLPAGEKAVDKLTMFEPTREELRAKRKPISMADFTKIRNAIGL